MFSYLRNVDEAVVAVLVKVVTGKTQNDIAGTCGGPNGWFADCKRPNAVPDTGRATVIASQLIYIDFGPHAPAYRCPDLDLRTAA